MRDTKRNLVWVKAAVLVTATGVAVYAYSSAPPLALTGGFGEPTCQVCHQFGPGNGSFTISGVPEVYTPGEVYTIIVEISQVGQSRWGFELATRSQADGSQAGDILVTDPANTQRRDRETDGVQYLSHTLEGTMAGTADGPVSWTFDWQAPDPAPGSVQFNAAGNAANNDGMPEGDFIYRAEVVSVPQANNK